MPFLSNLHFVARVVSLASFPFALLLSLPYPFTADYSWYGGGTFAPLIGLNVLAFAGLVNVFDLGYGKHIRTWLGLNKHEYRITLGSSNDDDGSKETRQHMSVAFAGDVLSIMFIAIILGFTMADLNRNRNAILVVYAALPYFFAGVSHLILSIMGLVKLCSFQTKAVQCPRCDYIIGSASTGPSPSHEHSPKMTGAGQADPERQPLMRDA